MKKIELWSVPLHVYMLVVDGERGEGEEGMGENSSLERGWNKRTTPSVALRQQF
jgi:hypothetical protein